MWKKIRDSYLWGEPKLECFVDGIKVKADNKIFSIVVDSPTAIYLQKQIEVPALSLDKSLSGNSKSLKID